MCSCPLTEPAQFLPRAWLGEAKITVTSRSDKPAFIGVAATRDGLPISAMSVMPRLWIRDPRGAAAVDPYIAPARATRQTRCQQCGDIWVAQSSGLGAQSLVWPVESGEWTVVLMNADGSAGVSADLAAGATVPALTWIVGILLSIAGTGLIVALALLVIGLRAARTPSPMPPSVAAAA